MQVLSLSRITAFSQVRPGFAAGQSPAIGLRLALDMRSLSGTRGGTF